MDNVEFLYAQNSALQKSIKTIEGLLESYESKAISEAEFLLKLRITIGADTKVAESSPSSAS